MLTGFDSKWLNTLYLDKEMEYQNIIQAFSRTNRIFGNEKPFGTINYYRRPYAQRYKELFKPDSGDPPIPDPEMTTPPYDIAGYLTEIDTGKIDIDYMNSHFEIYMNIITTLKKQTRKKRKPSKTYIQHSPCSLPKTKNTQTYFSVKSKAVK